MVRLSPSRAEEAIIALIRPEKWPNKDGDRYSVSRDEAVSTAHLVRLCRLPDALTQSLRHDLALVGFIRRLLKELPQSKSLHFECDLTN